MALWSVPCLSPLTSGQNRFLTPLVDYTFRVYWPLTKRISSRTAALPLDNGVGLLEIVHNWVGISPPAATAESIR
jgi:hypothetical protein